MADSLVSVTIPVYNGAEYVSDAIQSVLAQTYEAWELCVVDDGSTDETPRVLREFAAHPRVRIIRQVNRGVSAARNAGIAASAAPFLAFLDADDVWVPVNLARKVAYLISHPDVALVHSAVAIVDAALQPTGRVVRGRSGEVLEPLLLGLEPVVNGPSSVLARRSIIMELGGFDETLSTSADWDLWVRLAARHPIAHLDEALVCYRLRGTASMHRNIRAMEHDKFLAYAKAFTAPQPPEIARLRRRCYANLHMTLAGSYAHAGEWGQALSHAGRSLLTHPSRLPYALGYPWRAGRRAAANGFSE